MADKRRGRAGGVPPAAPAPENTDRDKTDEETKTMSTPMPTQTLHQIPREGVTVIGEAVRAFPPERAEFLMEITAGGATAAQALRDNHTRAAQVSQAVAPLGVRQADVQPIALNVYNVYAPVVPALPAYAGMPQIAAPPDVQFGSYQAKQTLRVSVRESARAAEILDAVLRAGVSAVSPFSFKAADEAGARRSTLEAAGKDARAKAEALAASVGKQVGDAVAIMEEVVASNGVYTALRAALPFVFGAGAPQVAGELEYYARVSANFRLQ